MVSTRRKTYHETLVRKRYHVHLLDLPEEILIKIISYLSYNTVANIRPVCTRINNICAFILKKGFDQLIDRCSFHFHLSIDCIFWIDMSYEYCVIMSLLHALWHLRKIMIVFMEKKDCVFFPGAIIDKGHVILRHLFHPLKCPCSQDFVYIRLFNSLCMKAEYHFRTYMKPVYLNLRSSAKLKKKA